VLSKLCDIQKECPRWQPHIVYVEIIMKEIIDNSYNTMIKEDDDDGDREASFD